MALRSGIIKGKQTSVSIIFLCLVFLVTAPVVYGATLDFTQCANDNAPGSKGDGTIDSCIWTNGALNAQNSDYAESDGVPQRLFFLH